MNYTQHSKLSLVLAVKRVIDFSTLNNNAYWTSCILCAPSNQQPKFCGQQRHTATTETKTFKETYLTSYFLFERSIQETKQQVVYVNMFHLRNFPLDLSQTVYQGTSHRRVSGKFMTNSMKFASNVNTAFRNVLRKFISNLQITQIYSLHFFNMEHY